MRVFFFINVLVLTLLGCTQYAKNDQAKFLNTHTNNTLKNGLAIIGNEKIALQIDKILQQYGGESVGTSFDPQSNKAYAHVYFPNGVPENATLLKINRDLSRLTGLDMSVKVSFTRLILAKGN